MSNTKTMSTVDFKKLISQAYSEPSYTSKMELFAAIGNDLQPLTFFAKNIHLK